MDEALNDNHRGFLLARFGVVGVSTAGLYFLCARLLNQYGGVSIPAAASVSFVPAVAFNYALHYRWTFRSRERHSRTLPRFLSTSLSALIINYIAVACATRGLHFPRTEALLFGAVLVMTWNYALARMWVFVGARRRAR